MVHCERFDESSSVSGLPVYACDMFTRIGQSAFRKLHKEIHKLNPADVDGYEEFLHYSEQVYEEGYLKLGAKAFLSFSDMMAAAPSLAKYQAWRSVYSIVSKYVEDEHLRQALSFHSLLIGGNPMKASSIYTLIHALERKGGVWYAKGGTNRMIAAMVTHFERLGGVVRLDDAVTKIDTLGSQVTAVSSLPAGVNSGQIMVRAPANKEISPVPVPPICETGITAIIAA